MTNHFYFFSGILFCLKPDWNRIDSKGIPQVQGRGNTLTIYAAYQFQWHCIWFETYIYRGLAGQGLIHMGMTQWELKGASAMRAVGGQGVIN